MGRVSLPDSCYNYRVNRSLLWKITHGHIPPSLPSGLRPGKNHLVYSHVDEGAHSTNENTTTPYKCMKKITKQIRILCKTKVYAALGCTFFGSWAFTFGIQRRRPGFPGLLITVAAMHKLNWASSQVIRWWSHAERSLGFFLLILFCSIIFPRTRQIYRFFLALNFRMWIKWIFWPTSKAGCQVDFLWFLTWNRAHWIKAVSFCLW